MSPGSASQRRGEAARRAGSARAGRVGGDRDHVVRAVRALGEHRDGYLDRNRGVIDARLGGNGYLVALPSRAVGVACIPHTAVGRAILPVDVPARRRAVERQVVGVARPDGGRAADRDALDRSWAVAGDELAPPGRWASRRKCLCR